MMKIDLHIHSTASDGTDSPETLAIQCAEKGVDYAALTDHDTLAGSSAFLKTAKRLGIQAVNGIEFSAQYTGELHILVYRVNLEDASFRGVVKEVMRHRSTRVVAMTQKLIDQGYDISHEQVQKYAAGGAPGRPHIARALVEKGYAKTIDQAFCKYLNVGCPGFVKRKNLTPTQILQAANTAGGVAVLAHPKLTYAPNFDKLFCELKYLGLAGVEAFYPEHSDEECKYFCELAQKYGLFVTQGSDFHGRMRSSTDLGKEKRGNENPLLKQGLHVIFEKK